MRFARIFRGFALVAGRSGDCWCNEGAGKNAGLLEELAPLDGAGATAVVGAVVAVAAPPTDTTGSEYALDIGRVEFVCSGGGRSGSFARRTRLESHPEGSTSPVRKKVDAVSFSISEQALPYTHTSVMLGNNVSRPTSPNSST
ncbi:hypothetical protein EDB83DRAFT_417283 [Lactarius deliciosus]|nr:hypothetical protein EDB83DRAFT_417283 [Lactarius deliciosus]